ncbi:C1 family peptidase [Deinococcus sonorensis]|uniref:C1 family peptidase n=2 Tax=Deinococcus sonorensis TaxID=309891 RepID=A0AAU7U6R3_9DEIO
MEETASSGTGKSFLTLSLADQLRSAADAVRQEGDPTNALKLYRASFDATPAALRAGLVPPQQLQGGDLQALQAAQHQLERALEGKGTLDRARPEARDRGPQAPGTPTGPRRQGLFNPLAGNGSDGPGDCPHSNAGIYSNFWWPLKRFITPIRDQGGRGTCWAFASVAAVESRDMVVSDVTRNLSEQYFVNRWKVFRDELYHDGDVAEIALSFMVNFPGVKSIIPPEGYWSYNPSWGRQSDFSHSCDNNTGDKRDDYVGTCNNTTPQAPMVCTSGVFSYCASLVTTYTDDGHSGAGYSHTTQVWKSGHDLPLGTLRALLSDGRAVLASFKVYRGFQQAGDDGFVTDYAKVTADGKKKGGGHAVLIVGFIDNATLSARLPNAPQASGGGYFIVKNSWGCEADGGFSYVPVDYVKKFFVRLSVLDVPAERSARWKSEVGGASATVGPTLTITAPAKTSTGAIVIGPSYIDFTQPFTLSGFAKDAQDGDGCCQQTFRWTSAARGPLTAGDGTGAFTVSNLTDLTADNLTLSARDSDGNTAQLTLSLADAYPVVDVSVPVPGQPVAVGAPLTLHGQVRKFGTNDTYACTGLIWKTNVPADGTRTGCVVTYTFLSPGSRTVTATYTAPLRPATSGTVNVQALQPTTSGPPTVTLSVNHRSSTMDPNAVVAWTFIDPGGPGPSAPDKYVLKWELSFDGVTKTITPPDFLGLPGEKLIRLGDAFTVPGCLGVPETRTVGVRLTVTDPEGLSGSGTASYPLYIPECIH